MFEVTLVPRRSPYIRIHDAEGRKYHYVIRATIFIDALLEGTEVTKYSRQLETPTAKFPPEKLRVGKAFTDKQIAVSSIISVIARGASR